MISFVPVHYGPVRVHSAAGREKEVTVEHGIGQNSV